MFSIARFVTEFNFSKKEYLKSKSLARINHLHERALRIVYNDNESTFEDLLKKDNSVSIHHKNIRLLGIELYKVKNNLSTHLMSEIFNLRNIEYNLRSQTDVKQGPVNTVNTLCRIYIHHIGYID